MKIRIAFTFVSSMACLLGSSLRLPTVLAAPYDPQSATQTVIAATAMDARESIEVPPQETAKTTSESSDEEDRDPFEGLDLRALARSLAQIGKELNPTSFNFAATVNDHTLERIGSTQAPTNQILDDLLAPVRALVQDAGAFVGLKATGEVLGTAVERFVRLADEKVTHRKENSELIYAFENAMVEYRANRAALETIEAQTRGYLHMMEMIYRMNRVAKKQHLVTELIFTGRELLIIRLNLLNSHQSELLKAIEVKIAQDYKKLDLDKLIEGQNSDDDITSDLSLNRLRVPTQSASHIKLDKLNKKTCSENDYERLKKREEMHASLKRMIQNTGKFIALLESTSDVTVCSDLDQAMNKIWVLENALTHARSTLLDPKSIYLWKEAQDDIYRKDVAKAAQKATARDFCKEVTEGFKRDRKDVEFNFRASFTEVPGLLEEIKEAHQQCICDTTWVPKAFSKWKSMVGKQHWKACWNTVTNPNEGGKYVENYKADLLPRYEIRMERLRQIDRKAAAFRLNAAIPSWDIHTRMIDSYAGQLTDVNDEQGNEAVTARQQILDQLSSTIQRVCKKDAPC